MVLWRGDRDEKQPRHYEDNQGQCGGPIMNRDEILDILRRFKREQAAEYGILEIGVFGSLARDEARQDSDVDIWIKTETPNPFVLVHIKEDIEAAIGRHVEIVRVREKMNPFLRERLEEEGFYVWWEPRSLRGFSVELVEWNTNGAASAWFAFLSFRGSLLNGTSAGIILVTKDAPSLFIG
jgi:predicted nucleotidyltransferase